jgi:hypothetical protein
MNTASRSVFYALHRAIPTWPTLSVYSSSHQPFPTGKGLKVEYLPSEPTVKHPDRVLVRAVRLSRGVASLKVDAARPNR